MALDSWQTGTFTFDGMERPTFRKGLGPGVVVIHEVPGITPKVLAFAEDVVAAGFTVVMPSLFGVPGKPYSPGYVLSSITKACVAEEFTAFALDRSSKIHGWLRALAAELHADCGGPGVGAVGMCFTGGVALGMMIGADTIAPVLSQPSLPLPVLPGRSAALNLSPEDLAAVKAKVKAGCPVMGLRYVGDPAVGTRFDTLRRELGDGFIAVELPRTKMDQHSVLTEHRDEGAVKQVIQFFRRRLQGTIAE